MKRSEMRKLEWTNVSAQIKMTRLHPAAQQQFIPCLYKPYNHAKAAASSSSPCCCLFTSSPNKQQSSLNEWNHNYHMRICYLLRLFNSMSFPADSVVVVS
eukprot:GHVS01057915.1.p1 GENE.GHVS01057915.1~~GHVS01057915.1.p1  ORF type:complete len:100 (+),score=17.36 GHVS01057915.1:931-1230(+)